MAASCNARDARRRGKFVRVSDLILQRLADAGTDTVFLVYGGAMGELADAFTRQDRVRYVCAQHEQGAVFMAEGYAKVRGVPGAVLVTSGPGGGNIVTGLQNCFYDSTPLIALCGQVSSNLIRPKGSKLRQLGFQETSMREIARPITKYAVTVDGPAHAIYCIDTAIAEATFGRPGPVLLEVPLDVQKAEVLQ
jgi:acetolactate synthase-1/2/3 large subunit